jgi:hypothetical protein
MKERKRYVVIFIFMMQARSLPPRFFFLFLPIVKCVPQKEMDCPTAGIETVKNQEKKRKKRPRVHQTDLTDPLSDRPIR